MIWFKFSKSDIELIKLLKKSDGDFKFDPNKVKYRLLASIEKTDQKRSSASFHIGRVAKYSISFASLVLMISATFAFASTSQPGDKLFALNKWGEKMVLNLPLSLEQKAAVREHIVNNRINAFSQIQVKVNEVTEVRLETTKLETTLRETDETFQTAVNEIVENKKQLENSGESAAAERLEVVLDNIQIKAEQQEVKIKELEDKAQDEPTRQKIKIYRMQMNKTREKARSEIRRYQKHDEEEARDEREQHQDSDTDRSEGHRGDEN